MRGFGGVFPAEDLSSAGLCTVPLASGCASFRDAAGLGVSDARWRRQGSCAACRYTAWGRLRFYTGCVMPLRAPAQPIGGWAWSEERQFSSGLGVNSGRLGAAGCSSGRGRTRLLSWA